MATQQLEPTSGQDRAQIDKYETAQFRATSAKFQGFGKTPQDAVTDLMALLPNDLPAPIVIWPYNRGDAFFSDNQIKRLQELEHRRETLTSDEYQELEHLVEESVEATIARTQTLRPVKS